MRACHGRQSACPTALYPVAHARPPRSRASQRTPVQAALHVLLLPLQGPDSMISFTNGLYRDLTTGEIRLFGPVRSLSAAACGRGYAVAQ